MTLPTVPLPGSLVLAVSESGPEKRCYPQAPDLGWQNPRTRSPMRLDPMELGEEDALELGALLVRLAKDGENEPARLVSLVVEEFGPVLARSQFKDVTLALFQHIAGLETIPATTVRQYLNSPVPTSSIPQSCNFSSHILRSASSE